MLAKPHSRIKSEYLDQVKDKLIIPGIYFTAAVFFRGLP